MRRARGIVEGARELAPDLAVGPVDHGRGERERLDGDALAIHGAPAPVEVVVPRLEGRRAVGADQDRRPAGIGAIDTRAERRARLLDDVQEGLGKEMRVDVDGASVRHGSGFYYARRV